MRYKTSPGKMYYSISEVSEMTDVKPHVLRYWESEFPTLRPKKNRAGNRNYRPKDIKVVLVIRNLLYGEKFTISGARKKLQETYGNPDPLIDQMQIPFSDPHARQILLTIKKDLQDLRGMLLGPEEAAEETVEVEVENIPSGQIVEEEPLPEESVANSS